MNNYFFDIIIPTYNRYKDLPEFFLKNSGLEKSNAQLWLIDDCSVEKDLSVIPPWPNLTFIELEKNRGQAFARNIAIDRGSAPYLISLDDDAWFEDVLPSLEKLSDLFETYPQAGCIMFNIATPESGYSPMKTGTILPLHVTCGCAYRREVLKQIGGFSGFLHSQAEETDISLRIYQVGWNIIFAKEIKVFHNFAPAQRSMKWYYNVRHNTTRNDLLNVVMYFPGILVLPFLTGKFLSHLKFSVTNNVSVLNTLGYTLLALFNFFRLAPRALNNRKPLTMMQFRQWRGLIKQGKLSNA